MLSKYDRLLELLGDTNHWVVLQESDVRNLIQDVDGSIITGMVTPKNAELIVRMRNQIGQLFEEIQILRDKVSMMDRG